MTETSIQGYCTHHAAQPLSPTRKGDIPVSDHQPAAHSVDGGEDRPIPVMQEIYDNIWFLFMLSMTIVLVSYIIWGLIDMLSFPTLP